MIDYKITVMLRESNVSDFIFYLIFLPLSHF